MLGDHQILVTLAILAVLAAVFLRGFSEAIGWPRPPPLPYLLLNLVVLGAVRLGGGDASGAARKLALHA